MARMLPGEAELVSELTGLSGRATNVSALSGPTDWIMRYKNYLYLTFTVHRQKRQPLSHYDAGHISFTFIPSPQI